MVGAADAEVDDGFAEVEELVAVGGAAAVEAVVAPLVVDGGGDTPGVGAIADIEAPNALSSVRKVCRFAAMLASTWAPPSRPLVPTAPSTADVDGPPIWFTKG